MDKTSFLTLGSILTLDKERLLIGWGERTWTEKPSRFPSWYFPPFFFEESNSYFYHPFTQIIDKKTLLSLLPSEKKSHVWGEPLWHPFEKAFGSLYDMVKVVPYVQKKAKGNFDAAAQLRAALEYHLKVPHTYLYGFWGEAEGMVGVTPELLMQYEGKRFSTMAVAGTVPASQAEEMVQDEKLQREHQIVIKGISENLKPLGKLEMGKTIPVRFSKLAHLVTPIQLHAQYKVEGEAVIRALHPTPALGAYPKEKAAIWLKNYALKMPRKRYGAPAGVYLSPEQGMFYVAIRNVQWEKDQLTLTAGCGIVAGSVLEKEKQEVLTKFAAIQEILQI